MSSKSFNKSSLNLFQSNAIMEWLWPPSWFGIAAAGTTTCVLSCMFALFYYQRALIYPSQIPAGSRQLVAKPNEFRMPSYEDVELITRDNVKIKGYLIKRPNPRNSATLMFFHANAGNMGHRLPIAQILYERLDCNIFLLSYRGYGFSDGSPSEAGLRIDAQTALEFVLNHPQIDPSRLAAYGQSLGGAVAIDTVARNPNKFQALIVENTFTSLPKLVPVVMPFLRPFTFLVLDQWNSENSIKKITCPALFLSGSRDELIPPYMMQQLYEKAKTDEKNKKLHKFFSGTHNDTCMQPGYFEEIVEFWRTLPIQKKTN